MTPSLNACILPFSMCLPRTTVRNVQFTHFDQPCNFKAGPRTRRQIGGLGCVRHGEHLVFLLARLPASQTRSYTPRCIFDSFPHVSPTRRHSLGTSGPGVEIKRAIGVYGSFPGDCDCSRGMSSGDEAKHCKRPAGYSRPPHSLPPPRCCLCRDNLLSSTDLDPAWGLVLISSCLSQLLPSRSRRAPRGEGRHRV
jgi:hypothetical protein